MARTKGAKGKKKTIVGPKEKQTWTFVGFFENDVLISVHETLADAAYAIFNSVDMKTSEIVEEDGQPPLLKYETKYVKVTV